MAAIRRGRSGAVVVGTGMPVSGHIHFMTFLGRKQLLGEIFIIMDTHNTPNSPQVRTFTYP